MSKLESRRLASLIKIETAITNFLTSLDLATSSSSTSSPSNQPTPTLHLGTAPPLPLISASPVSTKRLAITCRILELIHRALLTNTIITKRDIYYQDPALFQSQVVVDRAIDHLAASFGTTRAGLNVTAAAKGLVVGEFEVRRGDGGGLMGEGSEAVLVPSLGEADLLLTEGVQWVLVVEKEATFSSLVSAGLVKREDVGKGIMITGKGYPDLLTRAFLRRLSVSHARTSPAPDIIALVDYDPDGIAIASTYKHGSEALSHEGDLTVPQLQWMGVKSEDVAPSSFESGLEGDTGTGRGLLRLTERDRAKANALLKRGVESEGGIEKEWKRELQVMLMLNVKAETQLLDGRPGGLLGWLRGKLARYDLTAMAEDSIILDV